MGQFLARKQLTKFFDIVLQIIPLVPSLVLIRGGSYFATFVIATTGIEQVVPNIGAGKVPQPFRQIATFATWLQARQIWLLRLVSGWHWLTLPLSNYIISLA